MEKLDRQLQKRVWERVYAQPQPPQPRLHPHLEKQLRQCLQRCQANLAVYQQQTGHSYYGEAFRRLTTDTTEQIKMLQQMLRP